MPRPTTTSPINFTVVFSEAVSDFTSEDVTITSSRPGTLVAIVTGIRGTTYNVAVSGMTGDATVTATIAAGVAHDAYGNPNLASTSKVINGHADNIVEYLIAPDVGSVVVAEAGTVKNGMLESNEPIKITWAASSHYGIASQTMTIDGRTITPINGPYSGSVLLLPDRNGRRRRSHLHDSGHRPRAASPPPRPARSHVTAVGSLTLASVVVAEAGTTKNGVLDVERQPENHLGCLQHGRQRRFANHEGRWTRITPIVRPLQRIVLLLPDRNLGRRHSLLCHPRDRCEGQRRRQQRARSPWSRPRWRISSVVVAEAGTTKNGILEPSEPLKITWAASATIAVASQTITVDGNAITPINGPYSGLYYSCPIGTWAAGSHTYIIHATDTRGVCLLDVGRVHRRPAIDGRRLGDAASLGRRAQRRPTRPHRRRSGPATGSAVGKPGRNRHGRRGDQGGESVGRGFWEKRRARRFGSTTMPPATAGSSIQPPATMSSLPARPARTRWLPDPARRPDQHADLLTTVMHEMGHLLGYQHAADDLMQAVLPLGVRRDFIG